MIQAHELTKRYGDTTAVHSLSFTIAPSTVTGFLGPNGAGKSTTMRMIMALDRPTSGTVTVNGKPYRQHRAPLREVGALLEASAVHPGRSARSHLRTMAATHNIKASRVSEVIEMTGLAGVATKRVGGFSLGMGQRLGIAAALLSDPRTLILEEPVNGLDPEGVQWVARCDLEMLGEVSWRKEPSYGSTARRATASPQSMVAARMCSSTSVRSSRPQVARRGSAR